MTRKQKLTPDVINTVCRCTELGISLDGCARSAMIAPRTLRRWLKDSDSSDDSLVQELSSKYQEARSRFEEKAVRQILRFGENKSDWKAPAFLLKHREPQNYSEKSPTKMLSNMLANILGDLNNSDDFTDDEKLKFFRFIENSKYSDTEVTTMPITEDD